MANQLEPVQLALLVESVLQMASPRELGEENKLELLLALQLHLPMNLPLELLLELESPSLLV